MAQHLVLDIGGVLYRGWPDEAFWDRWTARTGLTRASIEAVLSSSPEHRAAQVGRMSADEAFRRAGERLGVDGPLLRGLAEDAYLSEFNRTLAAAARQVRASGVGLSALTNSLSPEAEWRTRPGFEDLFDHIVSSHDVGCAKPEAAIFAALLDRLTATPQDVVFVDDAESHVTAARDLGFTALHFRSTGQILAELAQLYPTAFSSRR
jgi:putative hydrolase of the HAD superfamily